MNTTFTLFQTTVKKNATKMENKVQFYNNNHKSVQFTTISVSQSVNQSLMEIVNRGIDQPNKRRENNRLSHPLHHPNVNSNPQTSHQIRQTASQLVIQPFIQFIVRGMQSPNYEYVANGVESNPR